MAYLKVKYKKILERIDKELKLPKGWKNFVRKETEKDVSFSIFELFYSIFPPIY